MTSRGNPWQSTAIHGNPLQAAAIHGNPNPNSCRRADFMEYGGSAHGTCHATAVALPWQVPQHVQWAQCRTCHGKLRRLPRTAAACHGHRHGMPPKSQLTCIRIPSSTHYLKGHLVNHRDKTDKTEHRAGARCEPCASYNHSSLCGIDQCHPQRHS